MYSGCGYPYKSCLYTLILLHPQFYSIVFILVASKLAADDANSIPKIIFVQTKTIACKVVSFLKSAFLSYPECVDEDPTSSGYKNSIAAAGRRLYQTTVSSNHPDPSEETVIIYSVSSTELASTPGKDKSLLGIW